MILHWCTDFLCDCDCALLFFCAYELLFFCAYELLFFCLVKRKVAKENRLRVLRLKSCAPVSRSVLSSRGCTVKVALANAACERAKKLRITHYALLFPHFALLIKSRTPPKNAQSSNYQLPILNSPSSILN